MKRRRLFVALASVVVALATTAEGQFGRRESGLPAAPNVPYDGRFTFVRIRYGRGTGGIRGPFNNSWNHDYPRADMHLSKILKTITFIDARTDATNILTLDDPDLFKYPIAYMSEPGYWAMTDREAQCFREYLLKGGFAIFDDFEYEPEWNNFEAQMRRVFPEGKFVPLDVSHTVYDSFFRMTRIDFPHPMYGIKPDYRGLYERNDPTKRLMVIANHNADIAEYWEWSDTGLLPVDLSNEAYKLGVNYIIYGMTH